MFLLLLFFFFDFGTFAKISTRTVHVDFLAHQRMVVVIFYMIRNIKKFLAFKMNTAKTVSSAESFNHDAVTTIATVNHFTTR